MNQGFNVSDKFKKTVNSKFKKHNHNRVLMNWSEIIKIKNSGLRIGSHTVNHKILSFIDETETKKEIFESINNIERYTNNYCNYFAYPNGLYNKKTIDCLQQNNIDFAFTTKNGINSLDTNRLELKRIGANVSDSSIKLLIKIFIACLKK